VPQALQGSLGIPTAQHWMVYLGVFVCSIAGTIPLVLGTERSRQGPGIFVFAVLLLAGVQALLGHDHGHLWWVLVALTVFFAAFNYLEARLPALLTQSAQAGERGAVLGVFATAQFLGAFLGGAIGGLLLGQFGLSGVFWGSAVVAGLWAVMARRQGMPRAK
jgi:predicted MFS family arabinose efflux permease